MSETIASTATTVNETPIPKKNRFSKKNIAIAAGAVAATAAAAYAIVKFNSDDAELEGLEVSEQPAFETTVDVTTPDQS